MAKIEETDVLTIINQDVNNILIKYIHPLPYCIPDECIVDENVLDKKHIIIADLIPNEPLTYRFAYNQEHEYNAMYQESLFAYTIKKGGWDCLRHYEILANGCIPIFKDLSKCNKYTLASFPKELIINANKNLLPWKKEYKDLYNYYIKQLLNHVKEKCSTSATIKYFLSNILIKTPKNVLLITGHLGINYTRETFWIGMKRYIQSINGIAVEYPKINFLYEDYGKENAKNLYGCGFTYSRKLKNDYEFTESEIINKIDTKFWDLIIYGKVGPDELLEGNHPNMPLWEHVIKKYNKEEIIFLYGGDECNDITYNNRYKDHIMHNAQFGHCFVRELNM
jgi:hypothetical protein